VSAFFLSLSCIVLGANNLSTQLQSISIRITDLQGVMGGITSIVKHTAGHVQNIADIFPSLNQPLQEIPQGLPGMSDDIRAIREQVGSPTLQTS
jgi:hypothetical protein